jgi:hypothetical protein
MCYLLIKQIFSSLKSFPTYLKVPWRVARYNRAYFLTSIILNTELEKIVGKKNKIFLNSGFK